MKIEKIRYFEYSQGISVGFSFNEKDLQNNKEAIKEVFNIPDNENYCLDGLNEFEEYIVENRKKLDFEIMWEFKYNDEIYLGLAPKPFFNKDLSVAFFEADEINKIVELRDNLVLENDTLYNLIGVDI